MLSAPAATNRSRKLIRPLDHEMHVIKTIVRARHCLHELRAEGNVIDKVPVHRIEVQPVHSGADRPRHFVGHPAPVRREYARGDDALGRIVILPHRRQHAIRCGKHKHPRRSPRARRGWLGRSLAWCGWPQPSLTFRRGDRNVATP